jgi:hypothetical protein
MSKGAALDEALIHAAGLAEQLLTLAGPIENRHHPVLQEPMFVLRCDELSEPVYLERKYIFDNQISIKSTYGKGDKVLAWLARSQRQHPREAAAAPVEVLLARDFFLLGDWREFQRFKQFIKSMRILDAQARQWLTDHHQDIPRLATADEGIDKVLTCLGHIQEWPELEHTNGPSKTNSLEVVAKTFSRSLVAIRDAGALGKHLLTRDPAQRFALFRMLSFVEDPGKGATGLTAFLVGLAQATGDQTVITACTQLKSSRDLARAFAALRTYLLSAKMPASGG